MPRHPFWGIVLLLLLSANRACGQGYRPAEAAGKMRAAEGLEVKLFASEPDVRQPILVKCDERGRVWTVQYLQYPNPAGLKRVQVDRWSRAVYDRVPEPPPRGPRGADRITICEDTNGDGRADRFRDFVSGLNLCTGLAFGHGGVFVLQVPYLLFYPDRNRDDVPDGDPEVLLRGFGMEDAQSLVNHLTWGPDGWLYGVTGSTSTNVVRGIEFQQGVWRYHPRSRRFELFCEGGGNLFGLTFDRDGNLFFSSNGSMLTVHGVQGGYYRKVFDKHGPLHNPYAYGFLETIRHTGQARGPTPGATICTSDTLPARFRDTLLCCDFLDHSASWWTLKRRGSTFEASFGGRLLEARDTWFCAPDLCQGPDGSLFVCDFHDRRLAHPDPDAEWDRSNGRVYRIQAAGAKVQRGLDMGKMSTGELVTCLRHNNGWIADQARVLLAARRDRQAWPALRELTLQEKDGRLALQGLWALHVSDGLTDDLAGRLLAHPYEQVRSWTIRLLGDEEKVTPEQAKRLVELARSDPSVMVRSQLTSSARRLPGLDALPIIEALLLRDVDGADPHIPWLLWWALESKALSDRERLLDLFLRKDARRSSLVQANLPRLIRRWAAEGSRAGYDACARLLDVGPPRSLLQALDQGLSERGRLLGGMGMGSLFGSSAGVASSGSLATRKFEPISDTLLSQITRHWRASPDDPLLIRLALRAAVREANPHLLRRLADGKDRLALLDILAELGQADCVPTVLDCFTSEAAPDVKASALTVLARFADQPRVRSEVLRQYPKLTPAIHGRARDLLFSQKESARAFLALVESGRVPPAEVPLEQLRRLALHGDPQLNALVRKHWGSVRPGTPEEKLAVMRRLRNDLNAGKGDRLRGAELFKKHCAACHRLFGEGGTTGPDLTGFARQDTEALLASLVDPGAVVKKEFLTHLIVTKRGLALTGLIVDQDGGGFTVIDGQNTRTRIRRDDVEEIKVSSTSMMPERLLEGLKPQELRDLFAYLQGNKP